jgi:6-pyruvoyltetrahydropterin/6-carboxytetrahydropterin synthase
LDSKVIPLGQGSPPILLRVLDMVTITRQIHFDYGHRVLGHEGKCRHLHGHHGVAEITVRADSLDSVGRVVDFGVIKSRVGGWIEKWWDHALLLSPEDPQIPHLKATEEQPPYVMEFGNPTAENMAAKLFFVCKTLLPELKMVRVRIWETPQCHAEYSLDDNSE